jgi:phosphatidylserine/phosphatidylglycerophosphate/cardiolipin synthase-like enzyme
MQAAERVNRRKLLLDGIDCTRRLRLTFIAAHARHAPVRSVKLAAPALRGRFGVARFSSFQSFRVHWQ